MTSVQIRTWLAATLAKCAAGANARREALPPQSYAEKLAIWRAETPPPSVIDTRELGR
jgi:hypothetical protein